MSVTTRFTSDGLTDTGRQRTNNEDRILHDPERGIFCVIDGMGGHAAGEKAAAVAHDMLRSRLTRQTGTCEERLREAITLANNEIYRLGSSREDWSGMACVLTAAVLAEDGSLVIGHVGDSRLYLLSPGHVRKVTNDHSPVGEREDAGLLSEAEAMKHPRRSEVFRDVGSEEHAPDDDNFIDIQRIPFPSDNAFVMCSDGLSDLVASDEIRRIVEQNAGTPHVAVRALIAAANRAGGKDNISIIVVEASGYAAAVRARFPVAPLQSENSGWFGAIVTSRLAFLLYGLTLGLIVIWFAFRYVLPHYDPLPPGPAPIERVAQTLVVGPAAQYKSAAEALGGARPGDTIVLAPGVYRENLQLKEGITVISREAGKAVIQSTGVIVTATGVRGVRLSGLRIAGDTRQPAQIGILLDSAQAHLSNLEVTGMQTAGVVFTGNAGGSMIDSRIFGNRGTGVVIGGDASPELSRNSIVKNGTGANKRPGLEIRDTARPKLVGNTIQGNGAEEIWAPPLFDRTVVLQQNTIGRPGAPATRKFRVITE